MRLIQPLVLGLTLLLIAACSDQTVISHDDTQAPFVRVEGGEFYIGDEVYHFVGTNMWYGAYLGAPGGDRTRLLQELDLLKATGIDNLRVLAVSETSDLMRAVSPAVLNNMSGEINESLWQGLDFLLAEMAKRDMKAVLYLNNFWQWSGGMSQYVAWFTGTPVLDPDVTGKWNPFMQNSARFYRLNDAQQLYRNTIKSLITRTNTVTGRVYRDDSTIMSWQLANEPRPGSDADGRPYYPDFARWIDESAGYIKSLAPHQLVSTGNEGAMGTLGDAGLFEDSHASDNVDYLTFHMWIKNWSWFDITQPEATYADALAKAKVYMQTHVEIAQRLNKPLVLEEFGVERDGGAFALDAAVTYRDRFYREVFSAIEQDAKNGGPFAGSNFWAWGGYGRSANPDDFWRAGDDFVGDPPQEPQGLNSVFDTDTSTLKIIKQHASSLHAVH